MPNNPSRNKKLAIALKIWTKSAIKLFMKDRMTQFILILH